MRSLLLLSAALHASCEVYENLNNVVGVSPGKDVEGVNKYLGKTDSMDRCMSVGKSYAGVTYFNSTYSVNEDFRDMCYGVNTSLSWNPTPQQGAWSTWDHQSIETPCETNDDCSRNGNCVNGFCSCFPQWTGAHCSVLNLIETGTDLGLEQTDISTWGGSVLYDETDGLYHMWAAEMINSCGIRAWRTNSQIRHATSPDPLTVPFTPKEVVFGVFAHEPTVTRDPSTGDFLIIFTAMFAPNIPCTNHSCDTCSMGTTTNNETICPGPKNCNASAPHLPMSSYMSYSSSSNGPWSEPQLLPSPISGDTNLAPLILKNGSLVGLGRPPYVWRSDDWRNASTYTFEKAAGPLHGEDPFIYLDRNDVLHAVLHGGGWADPLGLHFWSTDNGFSWKGNNNVHAYDSKLTYTSSTVKTLSRRERPHLVFAKDNHTVPIAITNGVTPVWPCDTPLDCPTDRCYTSLQGLNQG
eukprot:TRINITY_DN2074_c0_g1_i2.p1 TRINITY_DN2074_c0_g1~~TRINITY_DN2074_c0_g1_i2.p1  ORF type:complete len:496 (+),score=83.00 TRINITY_DN2074_c0_g1_i2:95-1489(+)